MKTLTKTLILTGTILVGFAFYSCNTNKEEEHKKVTIIEKVKHSPYNKFKGTTENGDTTSYFGMFNSDTICIRNKIEIWNAEKPKKRETEKIQIVEYKFISKD